MAAIDVMAPRRFGETSRKDAWWIVPGLTAATLLSFVVYATWAAFQGEHYHFGNYLSPFYSPELFGNSPHSLFGPLPSIWPAFLPFSPALLILWAPGGFRFTCYYYRGSYYKAIWADPPACSVGEPRHKYIGESAFPLIFQNAHRFFLYAALFFLVFLAHDAYQSFWFADGAGGERFGIGVGSIVLTLNTLLLSSYTFSCHSLRHLVGGYRDSVSKGFCPGAYTCVSAMNTKHMLFAWCSLFSVAFADIYVRMLSMGVWTDFRIL